MLMAFTLNKGLLEPVAINAAEDLISDILWIDLINPTEEEREWVRTAYQQELPSIASRQSGFSRYAMMLSGRFLK